MNVNSTLDFIVGLHKRNSASLGFIPKPTMKKFVENGQVFLKNEGGLYAGYFIVGSTNKTNLKIYQACIEEDLRKLTHGKKLFKEVIEYGLKYNCNSIILRCRENLKSNRFWKAMGCDFLYLDKRQTQRTKKGVNVWEYKIKDKKQLNLFDYG